MRLSPQHIAPWVLLLAGCEPMHDISMAIGEQFYATQGRTVDLSTVASGEWDRVCILGPYSDDRAIAQTLGFPWSARHRSSIDSNDGISLLLFVRKSEVVSWSEHPRGSGDFSNLSGRCFQRARARFQQVDHPVKGRPGLYPESEA